MTPKIINTFISSANRENNEPVHNFTVDFTDDLIKCEHDQYIRVNVISFDMINTMYNINETNNTFYVVNFTLYNFETYITSGQPPPKIQYNIPIGNYSVISLKKWFNDTFESIFTTTYNVSQNTFTFATVGLNYTYFYHHNCAKLLGIYNNNQRYGDTSGNQSFDLLLQDYGYEYLSIVPYNPATTSYINLTNYSKVILRTDSLNFDVSCIENVRYTNNSNKLKFSNILFWISKQDTEPFRNISYTNNDSGNSFNVMLHDKNVNKMNLQLTNELGEYIKDAPDYLLVLQFCIYEKDEWLKKTLLEIANNIKQIFVSILWIAENFLNIL